jgi:hypothetical protein
MANPSYKISLFSSFCDIFESDDLVDRRDRLKKPLNPEKGREEDDGIFEKNEDVDMLDVTDQEELFLYRL